ncbi:MAG: hypothetical protein K2K90_17035 [Lachnospiraceae bacterium]|nr:hypothetical protein [Lachnospiraceae bacterium]
MKVIYSRMAQGRKRKFQIITKIVSANGNKYVWKEAACVEAKQHVENTFHNESVIEPVYGNYLLHGQWMEGGIVTPFIEGKTLGSRLREHLEEQNGEEKVGSLLRQWRRLIIGDKMNVCKFVTSKDFETVFGEADDLTGVDATAISNFDCSAENIFFLQNNDIKIIDYEWVFPFPIPVEMSFYRVLKTFFECNQGLTDWKKLLELAGISRNHCARYDRMIESFAEYTSVDHEKNVNYALLGKKFKSGRILERNKEIFLYRFPYDLIPEGKEIVLYGAGRVGEDFYKLIRWTKYCQIAAWVDKSAEYYRRQGLSVSDLEDIMRVSYDYILIAVYQENVAKEIKNELAALGVSSDKIVWGKPELL